MSSDEVDFDFCDLEDSLGLEPVPNRCATADMSNSSNIFERQKFASIQSELCGIQFGSGNPSTFRRQTATGFIDPLPHVDD
ncbi:hypothetical protein A1O3_05852 [Capronia epimyces CBS 606.96]|uniref:Uncharacterized protein n=1 Tax=Capronia epimyces CBS 606.96 TaxID=1182542 RepID=W9XX73_9EURO|nr:uncharacterized protein A1O3_05852 [Capronia epimyces CBS 606.96]EXJ85177.1 hypothetical protein A1O3_05852 [Capronia epimyces CBS 606.96]